MAYPLESSVVLGCVEAIAGRGSATGVQKPESIVVEQCAARKSTETSQLRDGIGFHQREVQKSGGARSTATLDTNYQVYGSGQQKLPGLILEPAPCPNSINLGWLKAKPYQEALMIRRMPMLKQVVPLFHLGLAKAYFPKHGYPGVYVHGFIHKDFVFEFFSVSIRQVTAMTTRA